MGGRDYGYWVLKSAIVASSVGLLCLALHKRTEISRVFRFTNALRDKKIVDVNTAADCEGIVNRLKNDCGKYKVLGLDCEWVSVGGVRRPVALLQLGSHTGFCALIRLCKIRHIPEGLRELLQDENIFKVGVATAEDAQKLAYDYGVGVASTFDLRFLAKMADVEPGSLANLARTHLSIKLNKDWRLSCSNWEAASLSAAQKNYAADDALVAIEIFKKLAHIIKPTYFFQSKSYATIYEDIHQFLEQPYKSNYALNSFRSSTRKGSGSHSTSNNVPPMRKLSTLSKRLYDNCLLEAPDGELLTAIMRRRAEWYLQFNLATKVNDEPFTVRLNFEPSGRAVGDVGRYYKTVKENKCVVCGGRNELQRKNVVPHEYRRYFPVVMKSHTSHDVQLLCLNCHRRSNMIDSQLRLKLAEKCAAPIISGENSPFQVEIAKRKTTRSAARALISSGARIPEYKARELRQRLSDYFGSEVKINAELLKEASNLSLKMTKLDACRDHGEKVVNRYCEEFGGLIELEKLWREHFLENMRPKYLPPLWDVNHGARRLLIRVDEGRISSNEVAIAGVQCCVATTIDAALKHS